jgi:membrane-bound metal-dependent hydrolase YbcI (DUF457 family)
LTDIVADVLAVFLAVFLAGFPGLAAAFAAGVLGDFLRVFLDIRLPFVAFGGSIMGLLRVRSGGWANWMTVGYGDREFDATSVGSLNVLLGPDDE